MEHEFVASIVCPGCHAALEPSVEKCPECGIALDDASAHPATPSPAPDRVRDQPWFLLVLMLHVGLLGIPVYLSTRYSQPVRWSLVLVSILYTVFVVMAVYYGVIYIWRQLQLLA